MFIYRNFLRSINLRARIEPMSTLKVRFSAPHLPKLVNLRIWISLIRENEQ